MERALREGRLLFLRRGENDLGFQESGNPSGVAPGAAALRGTIGPGNPCLLLDLGNNCRIATFANRFGKVGHASNARQRPRTPVGKLSKKELYDEINAKAVVSEAAE